MRRSFSWGLALVILVGLVAGAGMLAPRAWAWLNPQGVSGYPELEDRTSPEALATRTAAQEAWLHSAGWVDQEAGVAHIPVEQAMAMLAEEGVAVRVEEQAGEQAGGGESAAIPEIDPATVSFQSDVLPIFMEHCSKCHGEDEPEEGLVLLSHRDVMLGSLYGSVVSPGDPDNSYLVEMIVSGKMPKRGDPLSPEEIGTIIAWVKAGAPDN